VETHRQYRSGHPASATDSLARLVAVKAHHTAAPRLLAAGCTATGSPSAAERPDHPILPPPVGASGSWRRGHFGADMTEPGVVLRGNLATFMVGEPDGRLSTGSRAAADIAGAWRPANLVRCERPRRGLAATASATCRSRTCSTAGYRRADRMPAGVGRRRCHGAGRVRRHDCRARWTGGAVTGPPAKRTPIYGPATCPPTSARAPRDLTGSLRPWWWT